MTQRWALVFNTMVRYVWTGNVPPTPAQAAAFLGKNTEGNWVAGVPEDCGETWYFIEGQWIKPLAEQSEEHYISSADFLELFTLEEYTKLDAVPAFRRAKDKAGFSGRVNLKSANLKLLLDQAVAANLLDASRVSVIISEKALQ
jgi:hypothetical protein